MSTASNQIQLENFGIGESINISTMNTSSHFDLDFRDEQKRGGKGEKIIILPNHGIDYLCLKMRVLGKHFNTLHNTPLTFPKAIHTFVANMPIDLRCNQRRALLVVTCYGPSADGALSFFRGAERVPDQKGGVEFNALGLGGRKRGRLPLTLVILIENSHAGVFGHLYFLWCAMVVPMCKARNVWPWLYDLTNFETGLKASTSSRDVEQFATGKSDGSDTRNPIKRNDASPSPCWRCYRQLPDRIAAWIQMSTPEESKKCFPSSVMSEQLRGKPRECNRRRDKPLCCYNVVLMTCALSSATCLDQLFLVILRRHPSLCPWKAFCQLKAKGPQAATSRTYPPPPLLIALKGKNIPAIACPRILCILPCHTTWSQVTSPSVFASIFFAPLPSAFSHKNLLKMGFTKSSSVSPRLSIHIAIFY
ncbi:hypothetical protein VP01_3171g1 [Puccinia sorghi]|uniref:Uncharacterized protein n=1 Tax=Puccinia sorghi TaxID=27349 RepID=A0A0L6UZI2_9BASI|nr:hypothetical protein VP01_3171g1 [Puccinia sorghi]